MVIGKFLNISKDRGPIWENEKNELGKHAMMSYTTEKEKTNTYI
jgi:hypothetical protein